MDIPRSRSADVTQALMRLAIGFSLAVIAFDFCLLMAEIVHI